MSRLDRIRLWATPVLVVLLIVLGLALLAKTGVVDPRKLAAGKDVLAAIGSICTTITVLVTGVFAYYRFFRGRTFAVRLDLDSEVTMVDGPHAASLGLLVVSVKNIGSITVWQPSVTAKLTCRYVDGRVVKSQVDRWADDLRTSGRRTVIDPGESSTFSAEIFIDSDVWAVTHQVEVACAGHQWSSIRIVEGPAARRDKH